MILPSKHISPARCLLTTGAQVLHILDRPRSVSQVWDHIRKAQPNEARINYEWFVLALDLLFAMGAISYTRGLLARADYA